MNTMTLSERLAPLADNDGVTPRSAAELVRGALASDEPQAAERVYRAFRAWTWKALTTRRYDSEVRAWRELVRATAAAAKSQREEAVSLKLDVLSDLLYESIQFAEHEPIAEVLRRTHVRSILLALRPSEGVGRLRLVESLKLKDANLSRVLLMMQSAGLIEREQLGKAAAFRLTLRGLEARRSLLGDAHDHGAARARAKRHADGGVGAEAVSTEAAQVRDRQRDSRRRNRISMVVQKGTPDTPPAALAVLSSSPSRVVSTAEASLAKAMRVDPQRPEFVPSVQAATASPQRAALELEHA